MRQSWRYPSSHDSRLALVVGLTSFGVGFLLILPVDFFLKHVTSVPVILVLGISGSILMLTQGTAVGALVSIWLLGVKLPVRLVMWGIGVTSFLVSVGIGLGATWLALIQKYPHSIGGFAFQIYMTQYLAMFGLFRLCQYVSEKATQKPSQSTARKRATQRATQRSKKMRWSQKGRPNARHR